VTTKAVRGATALGSLVHRATAAVEIENGALSDAVARLLAAEAIRNLGCLYSRAVDDREHDTLVHLFTEDGSFLRRGVRTQGRDALRSMWQASSRRYAFTRHVTYNHVVVPEGPDAAVGWAAGQAELALDGGETLIAAYRYDDQYARRSDQWLFRERVLSFSYVVPVTDLSAALGAPDRVRWPGEAPDRGEYP
jgi:uncharacterized protein (TIGR02246 family)